MFFFFAWRRQRWWFTIIFRIVAVSSGIKVSKATSEWRKIDVSRKKIEKKGRFNFLEFYGRWTKKMSYDDKTEIICSCVVTARRLRTKLFATFACKNFTKMSEKCVSARNENFTRAIKKLKVLFFPLNRAVLNFQCLYLWLSKRK